MAGTPFLRDLIVVLAASFPVLWVCRRLRLPQIVGFLVTGIAIGPHALGWVHEVERVRPISELGVALILFFVGLAFPLRKLRTLGRTALVGGASQMALTTAAVAGLSSALGNPVNIAVFHGLVVSVSSTAAVLPVLKERDEMAAPYGRRFLAVSLFQDLAVIPLVLLLPALGAGSGRAAAVSPEAVAGRVGLAILGVVVLVALARNAAPVFLDSVVRTGSREMFTGAVVLLVLGMIMAGERAGVSAAMGAFAAGIVLGESDHVHEVAATLAPIRDLLSSLFFVSVGMLLSPAFVVGHPAAIAGLIGVVLLAKILTAYVALRLGGAPPRTALRSSLALATVGEFSFVLVGAGVTLGFLSESANQFIVSSAVVSMGIVPVLLKWGPRLAALLPERFEEVVGKDATGIPARGHIVVVGAGLNGTNVARVLHETRIPYLVVELDVDRIAEARREGLRTVRADATGTEGLEAAGAARALGIVVTIPDPEGARRVVRLFRLKNPDGRVIVRTRYIREVEALRAVGADEVIPEEYETSIELVSRVLHLLHVPGNVIGTQIRLLRDEAYRKLRDPQARTAGGRRLSALVAAGTSELFLVMPETAAEGRTLSELNFSRQQIAVPAVLRDGVPHAPPPPDWVLAAGDTIVLVGAHEDLTHAIAQLEAPAGQAGTEGAGGTSFPT
ncbi:MAG TPA: cation:proton antiporter [Thermoanaerobaculia bacterium]|nr:cation:proton antiporter [Thermoanaerobaculia bacterium]